ITADLNADVFSVKGGAGGDAFAVSASQFGDPALDGEGGSDTLDFSGFGSQVIVSLDDTLGTSDGFQGGEVVAFVTFDNIDALNVSMNAGKTATVTQNVYGDSWGGFGGSDVLNFNSGSAAADFYADDGDGDPSNDGADAVHFRGGSVAGNVFAEGGSDVI